MNRKTNEETIIVIQNFQIGKDTWKKKKRVHASMRLIATRRQASNKRRGMRKKNHGGWFATPAILPWAPVTMGNEWLLQQFGFSSVEQPS